MKVDASNMTHMHEHIPNSPEHDVVVFNNDQPYGITIVGQAQAGKTTLRTGITEAWIKDFDREATIVHFSNSDGFRGLTAEIIAAYGLQTDRAVKEHEAYNLIEKFIDTYGICEEQLNRYYHHPSPNSVLRTTAVNTLVAHVAENEIIRPKINKAGSRFMREIIMDPSVKELENRPDLFVLDARNIPECEAKFRDAGVKPLGAFIIMCDEKVVVDRIPDSSGLSKETRIKTLKERNDTDRNRILAKMSLPEDFPEGVDISEAVLNGEEHILYGLGRFVSQDPTNRPVVLNTEQTSRTQTMDSMLHVLSGLVQTSTKAR